jgi:VanZ family protein
MRAAPPAARPAGRATFVRHWLPVLAYMAFILGLSSAQTAGPTLFRLQDKILHFLVYAGFGVLLARAFRAAFAGRAGLPWPAGAALAGSVYGALDELYQSTVPGRTPDARDWAADTLGTLAAVLLLALAWRVAAARRGGTAEGGGAARSATGAAR